MQLSAYNTTDRQLHWLSQVIARINRTLVPPKKDDSHTNLYFDPVRQVISGRWIETPSRMLRCLLDINTWTIRWTNRSDHEFSGGSVLDKSREEIIADHGRFLVGEGVDITELDHPMHYEIPDYGIESIKKGDLIKNGLIQWIHYRDVANMACFDMLGFLQSESEVRIWPHHFDTAIYVQIKKELGLGFGLAMKDTMVGTPYFYLAGYGDALSMADQEPPGLSAGYWITEENWKGAALQITDISDHSFREAVTHLRIFIREVTSWYLHVSNQ